MSKMSKKKILQRSAIYLMYKLNEFCVKRTKCVLLLYYTLSLRLGHLYTAQTNSSRKRIF